MEPSGFFFLLNADRENIFIRTVRDGEPRTAASIFTQLLSSVEPDHTAIVGRVTSIFGLAAVLRNIKRSNFFLIFLM